MSSNRRLRIPPSGPFIVDPDGGGGPLEVGDGTPGLVFRAQGIRNAAVQAFTGANLTIGWQDPELEPGDGPAITELPWVVPGGYLYDLELAMPCNLPAGSAADDISLLVQARRVDTNTFSTLVGRTLTAGALCIATQFMVRESRLLLAVDSGMWDSWRLIVNAPVVTNAGVITDLLSMRMTQYALGSV